MSDLSSVPNPNVPSIPQPVADLGALTVVAQSLKQGVDSLGGSRGNPGDRAVTFNDLSTLGLPGVSQNLPVPWSPPIHQNSGGESMGHVLVWADQNATISADHFQLLAANPGSVNVNITGTPTSGEQVGCTVTLNGTVYTVLYTVQSTDTTLIKVNLGLQACLYNDQTASNCTVTPSSLRAALLAIGWTTQAGNAQFGNGVSFDLPLPSATNLAGVSSAHMTATASPNGSLANVTTDNGPYFSAVAYNPGRTPVAGDHIGFYRMDGQSTTGNIDTSYAGLFATIVSPASSAPVGVLRFATANGNGNAGATDGFTLSKGISTDNGSGLGQMLSDNGYGTIHSLINHQDLQNITGNGSDITTIGQGGISIVGSSTIATALSITNASSGGTTWLIQQEGSGFVSGRLDIANNGVGLHLTKTTGHATLDGGLTLVSLPTADPHVVGVVWDNAGVLNISHG